MVQQHKAAAWLARLGVSQPADHHLARAQAVAGVQEAQPVGLGLQGAGRQAGDGQGSLQAT